MTRNVVSAGGLTTTSKAGDVVQGSVAVQLPLTAGQPPVELDTDEYGKPAGGRPRPAMAGSAAISAPARRPAV